MKEKRKYPITIEKMIDKEIKFPHSIPQTTTPRRIFFVFFCLAIISFFILLVLTIIVVTL